MCNLMGPAGTRASTILPPFLPSTASYKPPNWFKQGSLGVVEKEREEA
jgi:hypothetical protein